MKLWDWETLPRWISIAGSGGKTTLLFALGEELAARGRRVLLTTTTHLAFPPPEGVTFTSVCRAEELPDPAPGRPLLWGLPVESGRMTGPGLEELRAAAPRFDHVICEGDGSRCLPLKWHREDEPCLPLETELLFFVAGLSALDRTVGETVHRFELSPWRGEARVTEEVISALVLRAIRHSSLGCPIQVLLNQADTPALEVRGESIAGTVREAGYPCAVCALQRRKRTCSS